MCLQRLGKTTFAACAEVQNCRHMTPIQHSSRGNGLVKAGGRERELACGAGNSPTYGSGHEHTGGVGRPSENLPHSVILRLDARTNPRGNQSKRQMADGQPQNEQPSKRFQQERNTTQLNGAQR